MMVYPGMLPPRRLCTRHNQLGFPPSYPTLAQSLLQSMCQALRHKNRGAEPHDAEATQGALPQHPASELFQTIIAWLLHLRHSRLPL
jgi:hypothetical protein